MAHAHTQIRTAVTAALTGLATTGARVFPNRLYPLADADLPGLRVFVDQDAVEQETIHAPVNQSHTLTLVVECVAKANTSLDATCDQMHLEVEEALASGLVVGGTWLPVMHTGSVYTDEAGGTAVGVKRLEFSVEFFTLADAPDVFI